jgi:hypothetical protein
MNTGAGIVGSNPPTEPQQSSLANLSNRDRRDPVRHGWLAAFKVAARVVLFRASQRELIELNYRHLTIGLLCTWLVGIGRYWDNPRVGLLQHLGVGSVIYVFVLSFFLWLIIWPLRPRHWSWFRLLTFVTLVSPPAVLYAIPVQMFFSLTAANEINAWFLAIVATWRVALLFFFLRRLGELPWTVIVTAALLPLSMIVVVITFLNLEKVVFEMMGGIVDPSPNDSSYAILILLTWISILLFVPLLIFYGIMILSRFWSFKVQDEGLRKNDEDDRQQSRQRAGANG